MTLKPFPIATAGRTRDAFTLAELLVSIVVVVIIIFMVAQLMTSTTAITRTSHRHIDTDTEARAVFDRMALDFAKMLKRIDVDYFVKDRPIITTTVTVKATDGAVGWERISRAVIRSPSSASCPAITPHPLQASKVRFRLSLIG